MARGPIKPKPNIVVSSPAETGLTYNILKMFKDDNEAQREKVKKMEAEIQAYREAFGEWQLCPKCNGQGLIEKPPYLAAEATEWVSTGELFTCDVCDGAKILARPLLTNDNPQTP